MTNLTDEELADCGLLSELAEPLTDSEQAEAMAHDALVYELSVALMRLDGNEGDPHQLVWCGGPIPEPWGDVWQKYEPQALEVLNAIGEGSARALVKTLEVVKAAKAVAYSNGFDAALPDKKEALVSALRALSAS